VAVPKRVMVVGGGPAGVEASLVYAQQGYVVSLYDKQPSLASGQLKLAATELAHGAYTSNRDDILFRSQRAGDTLMVWLSSETRRRS